MSAIISKDLSERFAGMSFVCAVFVVMMHIGTLATPGTPQWWFFRIFGVSGVLRVGVPFFFLAAGYFLAGHIGEGGWYVKALKTRCKTLLLPYMIWNVLYWLFCLILALVVDFLGYSPETFNTGAVGSVNIIKIFGLCPFDCPMLSVTWFIRNLFILVLLTPLLARLKVFGIVVLFIICEICFYLAKGREVFEWIILYTFSTEGILYYTIGIYLRRNPIQIRVRRIGGLVCLLLGLGLVTLSGLLERSGIGQWSMVLWEVFIPLVMIGIWTSFPLRPIGSVMKGYAFPLYLVHLFVTLILSGLIGLFELKELSHQSVWFFLLRTLMVLTTSIGIVRVIRLSPHLSRLFFGGR